MTHSANVRSIGFVGLASITALASPSFAQQGVPSQPARMISVGGQGGLPLNRTRTLLPPDAAISRPVRAAPVTTGPGFTSGPGFANGLVKPIVGPGPDRGIPAGTGGGYYFNPNDAGIYNPGTTISGSYSSDRLKLRFHLGAGCNTIYYPNANASCFPLSWYRSPWRYDSPTVIYSGPWYGTDPFVTQGVTQAQTLAAQQQLQQQQAAERALTPVERAEVAWRAGQTDDSIRFFREHLDKEPTDADAMRYLALVLIDDRKVEQAVALMAMAYQKDPKLAAKALPLDILPGGELGQRRRLIQVSTYANRIKTGSAWMTLAVLMQSERRDDAAAKMVEKSRAAGGNPSVLDELALSLN